MKRVFKSREQRLLFIGKAQSLKNPSVSFPNLGQKNAHLLSLKIPPALRCCIMCHYIRWRGRRGGQGGRMRHGGPGPFLRTQAVCRAQAISSQGQALLLRGPTWASRRERERGGDLTSIASASCAQEPPNAGHWQLQTPVLHPPGLQGPASGGRSQAWLVL